MDLTVIELMGMILGSGVATGGATFAGIRVHIQYLREQDRQHSIELDGTKLRLTVAERDLMLVTNMAERAHHRIDELKATA
jgi:hypothetical protein